MGFRPLLYNTIVNFQLPFVKIMQFFGNFLIFLENFLKNDFIFK